MRLQCHCCVQVAVGPFTPRLGYSGKIVLEGGAWGTADQSQAPPLPTD